MPAFELVPFGFLMSHPRNRSAWLEARLGQFASRFASESGLPSSGVSLLGVPSDVAVLLDPSLRGLGGEVDPFAGPGDWSRGLDPWDEEDEPLTAPGSLLVTETVLAGLDGSGFFDVSLPLQEVSGPSFSLTSNWGHRWESDWSVGGGVATSFSLALAPAGLSPAQLELFDALRSDGWRSAPALRAALAL